MQLITTHEVDWKQAFFAGGMDTLFLASADGISAIAKNWDSIKAAATAGNTADDIVRARLDKIASMTDIPTGTAGVRKNAFRGMDDIIDLSGVSTSGVKIVSDNIDEIRLRLKTEPDTAFFWSGRTDGIGGEMVAERIAKGRGGVTLESTLRDKNIIMPGWEDIPELKQTWNIVSAAYAEQVSGQVYAVVGNQLRQGNVWETVELPRLKNNPHVTRITTIDPKTQAEKIIFRR